MKASRKRLIVVALAATSATAADEPGFIASGPAEAAGVQEVVVTGSYFARNNNETPVTVVGEHELEATGINSNMLEILRKSVPAIAGRSNAGNSNANNVNQNTAGGSRVQIRNLDTLVLVDGRRLTSSGINAVGGKDFVDINRIPAAAIQRLEVLTDGASAIYGADAVGGVVNIILKSDFQGIEANTRAASADGGYTEHSAYVTAGAARPGAHIIATASWSRTDPLFQNKRPFSSPYVGKLTAYPGVTNGALLNPSLLSPSQTNPTGASATAGSLATLIANGTYLAASNPSIAPGISSQFDAAPYQTLLLQQDQRSFVTNGSMEILGAKLVAFGSYMYSQTQSFNQTFQAKNNLTTVTVPAGAPYDPLTTAFPGVTFGDLTNPLQTYNDSHANRVVLGLRGLLAEDWNWELGYTYDQSKLTQKLQNTVYLPNLPLAIAGGYNASGIAQVGGGYSRVITGFSNSNPTFVFQPALDPFARGGINQASVANLFGTESIMATSKLSSFDAKIVASPFNLPAGEFGIAFGGAVRREQLQGAPDANGLNTGPTAHLWGGGSYFDPFSAGRTVSAGFVEVRVPLASPSYSFPGVQTLELSAAGRFEHYSDSGNSTVPKIGILWRPIDQQVTFRGAYSKAYNAPTLYNLYAPDAISLSSPTLLATQLGNPKFTGAVYNVDNSSNPNLKPSKAQSRSFGMVLAPQGKGLTVSVDYTNVSQVGFQASAPNVLQSVDQLGPASPYANQIAFNNFPGYPGSIAITAPGQLTNYLLAGGNGSAIYSKGYFINLAGIQVQAVDYSVDYQIATKDWGKIALSTTASQLISYKVQAAADQSAYQYAGYATNPGYGTLPKYQLYSTLNWNFNPWELTISNTFIPSVKDIGAGGVTFYSSPTSVEHRVASYTTWDLQLAYTHDFGHSVISSLRLMAGVNNIANRMPPLAPQAYPDNNADTSTYSPIGRLIFASVTANF